MALSTLARIAAEPQTGDREDFDEIERVAAHAAIDDDEFQRLIARAYLALQR